MPPLGFSFRTIVSQLSAADIKRKVDPSRLQRVIAEEAVVDAAMDIVKYWGSRTFGGLLLMGNCLSCMPYATTSLI